MDPAPDGGSPPRDLPVGSASWVGSDCYESDSKHNIQTRRFLETVKWDILASKASSFRSGAPCTYSERFSIGQFNMVRRLTFDDGASWVVRVRLPPEATPAPLEEYDSPRAFALEIAAMKFFK